MDEQQWRYRHRSLREGVAIGSRLGHDIASGGFYASRHPVDVRRRGLLREVGATTRGRGLATITQSEPLLLRCSVIVWEVRHSPGAGHGSLAGSRSCSSFELGNDDLSGPLASDPLVLASLVIGDQPWGVGAAGYNHARQR